MTNAELSRDLALALGWQDVYPPDMPTWWSNRRGHVMVSEGVLPRGQVMQWRKFDYRAPDVCLPLIEWLVMKQKAEIQRCMHLPRVGIWMSDWTWGDTLPEAVARAVIAVKRKEQT